MLVSKFGGSHKTGFFLLDDLPTFFILTELWGLNLFPHYFWFPLKKSILYSSCTLENRFVNKGKAMKLQETESPKEPYNVQLSVKPIYSPVDDLLKKNTPYYRCWKFLQGNNFFKFLICTKIIPLGVFIQLHQEETLLTRNSRARNKSSLLRIPSVPNFSDAITVKLKWHIDTIKNNWGGGEMLLVLPVNLARDVAVMSVQIKFHILKTVFFVNILLPF